MNIKRIITIATVGAAAAYGIAKVLTDARLRAKAEIAADETVGFIRDSGKAVREAKAARKATNTEKTDNSVMESVVDSAKNHIKNYSDRKDIVNHVYKMDDAKPDTGCCCGVQEGPCPCSVCDDPICCDNCDEPCVCDSCEHSEECECNLGLVNCREEEECNEEECDCSCGHCCSCCESNDETEDSDDEVESEIDEELEIEDEGIEDDSEDDTFINSVDSANVSVDAVTPEQFAAIVDNLEDDDDYGSDESEEVVEEADESEEVTDEAEESDQDTDATNKAE